MTGVILPSDLEQRQHPASVVPPPPPSLPEAVRAKLEKLRGEAREAEDRVHALRERLAELESKGVELRSPRTRTLNSTPHQHRELEAAIEANEQSTVDARTDLAQATEEAANAKVVFERCADLASRFTALSLTVVSPVKLKKPPHDRGEELLAQVRRHIADLKDKVRTTEQAPPTHDKKKRALEAEVSRLAEAGKPIVGDDGQIRFRQMDGSYADRRQGHKPDMLAFTAWLHTFRFGKALGEALPPEPDGALSDKDRAARLAELKAQILDLERQEEALVEVTGLPRRPEADAMAVLGVGEADKVREAA